MEAIVEVLALHLHNLQVGSKGRIWALLSSSYSPGNLGVLSISLGLHVCNLNVAATDFLLGMLNLKVLVSCLLVGEGGPQFREEVVIRVFKDFEFGEITVIDNLGILEMGARWHLYGC